MAKNTRNKKDESKTIEAFILMGVSVLAALILFGAFGKAGRAITGFLVGVFGFAMYGYALSGIVISVLMLLKFRVRNKKSIILFSLLTLLTLILLFHVVTSKELDTASYGKYLTSCYQNSTAGGLLCGLLIFPFLKINYVFAVVLFSVIFVAVLTMLGYLEFVKLKELNQAYEADPGVIKYKKRKKPFLTNLAGKNRNEIREETVGSELVVENIHGGSVKDKLGRGFSKGVDYTPIDSVEDLNEQPISEGGFKNVADNSKLNKLFDDEYLKQQGYFEDLSGNPVPPVAPVVPEPENPRKRAIEELYKKTVDPASPQQPAAKNNDKYKEYESYTRGYRERMIKDNLAKQKQRAEESAPEPEEDIFSSIRKALDEQNAEKEPPSLTNQPDYPPAVTPEPQIPQTPQPPDIRPSVSDAVDHSERNEGPLTGFQDNYQMKKPERKPRSDIGGSHQTHKNMQKDPSEGLPPFAPKEDVFKKADAAPKAPVPAPAPQKPKRRRVPYVAPPIDILQEYPAHNAADEDFTERAETLASALATFGINATVIGHKRGSTFTRFEIQMPAGIPVRKVLSLADDIAMNMEVAKVRIQAPIPGKNAVGVEIPNVKRDIVGLKQIISSPEFNRSKHSISFALGSDIDGKSVVGDLAKMPHMLIAGATGSGKSVGINSLICSILYKYSPDDVKMILIDPKIVELNVYSGLPHLLVKDVIYKSDQVMRALDWAIEEMQRRYELFMNHRVQKLSDYNEWAQKNGEEKLPYIVLIIDELAELMESLKKAFEERIKRLTQLARASGIHLVVATQRPSVDIITGVIKNNLPSRVAYQVTSGHDSKTIINTNGAEKLLGDGDMLFSPAYLPEPIRLQGAFVSGKEVRIICDYIREHNEAFFDEQIEKDIVEEKVPETELIAGEEGGGNEKVDKLFIEALKLVIESNSASISKLQRRLTIGYPRAARIIDLMEQKGYISKDNGSKARDVYITMDKFIEEYGDFDE